MYENSECKEPLCKEPLCTKQMRKGDITPAWFDHVCPLSALHRIIRDGCVLTDQPNPASPEGPPPLELKTDSITKNFWIDILGTIMP